VKKGGSTGLEQGPQTPIGPVPSEASTSSGPTFDTLVQDQLSLKGEITDMKEALLEEKALNVKRYEDILSALSALIAIFLPLFSWTYFYGLLSILFLVFCKHLKLCISDCCL